MSDDLRAKRQEPMPVHCCLISCRRDKKYPLLSVDLRRGSSEYHTVSGIVIQKSVIISRPTRT